MNKETKMEFLMSIVSQLKNLTPENISDIVSLETENCPSYSTHGERQSVNFKMHNGYEFRVVAYIPSPEEEKV